ncbi:hypothetical protein EMIHUDRAFT_254206 [Emiliania huxleyi CCMP1516]|uniref:Uncharacterized protein n=2 Tax=Emiliania huxleyi TaxID=2903 RepID=A0A0D3JWT4_EMIH1|nr:hypothetical protein EMIHUDRAFT_254206 [Emiliania huxleyi CCMP1516]EOD27969.1 hypothetical protein EMIHUDRAFT_254206 [Emiliania huxleyi CCMP1516]|eukprot:XP_005780398.1 hypothetical protein EMIHUDRAFT_254206 [Emiliania huxleyi CCMP1516]
MSPTTRTLSILTGPHPRGRPRSPRQAAVRSSAPRPSPRAGRGPPALAQRGSGGCVLIDAFQYAITGCRTGVIAYNWAISHKSWNKYMHALHGNTAQEPPPAQEPLQAQGPSQAQQLPTLDRDQPPTQDRDRESQPQEAPQAQEPPQPQEAPQAQEPPQPQGAPPTQAPPQDANPAQLPSQIDINQIAAAIAAANAAATRIDREASAAAARAEREAMIAAFATASRTGHEEAMTDFATALRNALSNEGGATRGSLSAKVTRTYDADIPKLEGKNITPQMMAEWPRQASTGLDTSIPRQQLDTLDTGPRHLDTRAQQSILSPNSNRTRCSAPLPSAVHHFAVLHLQLRPTWAPM